MQFNRFLFIHVCRYEDLIVCAPMFSILSEEGAAFVYINNKRVRR